MTNDVVTDLQKFVKNFAEEGLLKTVGENVLEAAAHIKAVSERLSEVNQLPLEAPTYVLQGLTNFSVPGFTGPFELIPNQERVTKMATPVSLVNTPSDTLKRVLNIIQLENNSYHYLNTSNACNAPQGNRGHHAAQQPHQTTICFNCDNLHLIPDCKCPRDEANIARNMKTYTEKRPECPPHDGGRKK